MLNTLRYMRDQILLISACIHTNIVDCDLLEG